ncbi:ATP-binding protein [Methylobacterium gossipiicola]|uniref:Histidine kinase-, DNA gyrase B-, and HSP90-like ATPase n=1 Tax=Methylobacterium gossipiicola TaxID=582675 RepID=A0A1I2WMG7_9HYPH|nr:ATP-binding protein [Methylobacterium gossipiicola]SFH02475.1 Histidine kinase-, DNA gyrase B-, and HSP90-like ATPase [Methylobacterium gossipiicola]
MPKKFKVDTSPTKEVVVGSLTRDATIEACIFDLIDNAIDAARDASFDVMGNDDKNVLLESYEGFEIYLTINSGGVSISDNSGGIHIKALEHIALRFGAKSAHSMGIGVFGVGLNRALFKLGNRSLIVTDTGAEKATIELDNDAYIKSSDWILTAEAVPSAGVRGTVISIFDPPDEYSNLFGDDEWLMELAFEIATRYARFIEKNLKIELNGGVIEAAEPGIRSNGPYTIDSKYLKKPGTIIKITAGQHERHRFAKEPDYSKETNTSLTEQFGWTVFCNDRAIVVADRTDKTGWDRFHTEFYGFVGRVEFVSNDPDRLPWSTTKTDVDLNNPIYKFALLEMRKFAERWRSFTNERKKPGFALNSLPPKPASPKQSPPNGDSVSKSDPISRPPLSAPPQPKKTKKPIIKPDYHQFRTILPDDVDESKINDKHLAIVHEAKNLDLADFTYVGMALMRMLMEMSVIAYLHRRNKYDELKEWAIERRRKKGLTISVADEKKVVPAMDEILPYLDANPNVWEAKETYLKHSLKQMITNQPLLNSAIHNPFQHFNRSKAFEIRDAGLPMFRHLIES